MKFHRDVIIAYTDLAAAGSRAVLGINTRIHHVEVEELSVPGLEGCVPSCQPPKDEQDGVHSKAIQPAPVQVINCPNEQYTFVIINTSSRSGKYHRIASLVMTMCHESFVERLTILNVVHLDLPRSQREPMYENILCRYTPVTDYPPLPKGTLLSDCFLNTLLQMVQVEGISTSLLSVLGYKAYDGPPNDQDGSKGVFRDNMEADEDMANMIYSF